ncbi:MAG: hypothetical protein ABJB16_12985 [Saprospiraceae bacterium]
MRSIITYIVIALFIVAGCKKAGQKINIPTPVKSKFTTMYPEAEGTQWKMEDGKYEAFFHQSQKNLMVILTEDGTILRYQEIIDPSHLPQTVRDYVSAQLGGKKITSAITYTDPKGFNSYEIVVDQSTYLFAKDGQFVGKRN